MNQRWSEFKSGVKEWLTPISIGWIVGMSVIIGTIYAAGIALGFVAGVVFTMGKGQ